MSNLVVQTNVLALNAHRNMKTIGGLQEKSSQKLSSGYRVNSAADDAAGLAISEKMRAQIRGLNMASKNAQDAISLIQVAEGGMQEIDNMLQRIRELVVQVSNDTNENNAEGTGDRQKVQDEIDQLIEEIDSMSGRVEFNKKTLINGDFSDANSVYGATLRQYAATKFNYAVANAQYATASTSLKTARSELATLSTTYTAKMSAYAKAIAANASAATINATKLAYESAAKGFNDKLAEVTKLGGQVALYSATRKQYSQVVKTMSATVATWSTAATDSTFKGLYMQLGANAEQGFIINIGKITTDILGIGDGKGKANKSVIDVRQNSGVSTTGILNTLDVALSYVTTERSRLGAAQNRVEYTAKSLDITSENLSAAESRIRDTDMAKEMMNLTKANVLQQATVSMLAQANQSPQSILQLLR
jgi:flagellin